jgi:ferredoxin
MRRSARRIAVKVEVDLKICVGHGKCYLAAPEIFQPSDDVGQTKILRTVGPDEPDLFRRMRNAVNGCPEGALRIVED